jgi:hypothetical protein
MLWVKNVPAREQGIHQVYSARAVRDQRHMGYRQMMQQKRHQRNPCFHSQVICDDCRAAHSGATLYISLSVHAYYIEQWNVPVDDENPHA